MIIKLLLDLIYGVFYLLTAPINIPSLPSDVHSVLNTIIEYCGTGIAILSNYCHLGYLLTLFGIIIAVDVGIGIYHIVMFVIKKIPMLSIS